MVKHVIKNGVNYTLNLTPIESVTIILFGAGYCDGVGRVKEDLDVTVVLVHVCTDGISLRQTFWDVEMNEHCVDGLQC